MDSLTGIEARLTESNKWLDARYLNHQQTLLLNLFKSASIVLERHEVPYWISSGTLLGVQRHGGFVPHDDDIDIECFESDYDRIKDAFKGELTMTVQKAGFYETDKVTRMQVLRVLPVPYVDLPGRLSAGLDICLRSHEFAAEAEFPSVAEVFPLERYHFHGVHVFGPCRYASILSRGYGPDWATTVRVWNHNFNCEADKSHDRDRVTLSLEEYNLLLAELGYRAPEVESPVETASDDWRQFSPSSTCTSACMARVWAEGKGGQCTRAPEGPYLLFCNLHGAPKEKWKVFGRVDGPIPFAKLKSFLTASGRSQCRLSHRTLSQREAKENRADEEAEESLPCSE